MYKILSGDLVRKIDEAYISQQKISSWALMERAANSFCEWMEGQFDLNTYCIYIFSGPGNNGGDGVAIARLLSKKVQNVVLVVFEEVIHCSKDYQLNFEKLPSKVEVVPYEVFDFSVPKNSLVIDAIFGVGINRAVEGKFLSAIDKINKIDSLKISVDLPSGIPSDDIVEGRAIQADFTVTFQFPKFSLLFPEHATYTGEMHIADIGIPFDFLESFHSDKFFLEMKDIPDLHKQFHRFSHKGNFGRVLLFGGSVGKIGAMVLCAKAALRTGSGLVHVQISDSERAIIQTAVPEVMVAGPPEVKRIEVFDALGIGPGWGTEVDLSFYSSILKRFHRPLVIDADGLNLLAKKPENLKYIPKGSILTPHLKEFERLAGESSNHKIRLEKARQFAMEHQVHLVLKGAYSSISTPEGIQYFNSTANQYMATAGSGDVLTGMITSFLGQGYSPLNAAICGVFHHGMAGNLASDSKRRGMIASDIIEKIPATFLELGII